MNPFKNLPGFSSWTSINFLHRAPRVFFKNASIGILHRSPRLLLLTYLWLLNRPRVFFRWHCELCIYRICEKPFQTMAAAAEPDKPSTTHHFCIYRLNFQAVNINI
jgi:hypothetical protein